MSLNMSTKSTESIGATHRLASLAKQAHSAISHENNAHLVHIISIDINCLAHSGKYNPLHHALNLDRFSFVIQAVVDYYKQKFDDKIGITEERVNKILIEFYELTKHARDQYNRTFHFRYERKQQYHALKQKEQQSNGIAKLCALAQLKLFNLEEKRIQLADRYYYQQKHIAKRKSSQLYTAAHLGMMAFTSIGTLAVSGPLRFGLTIAWQLMPNTLSNRIYQGAALSAKQLAPHFNINPDSAEYFTKEFAQNSISFMMMPEYFLLSKLLENGVYFTLGQTQYQKLEVAAYFAADTLAVTATNAPIIKDANAERHQYRLINGLSAYLGENLARRLTPWVVGFENQYAQIQSLVQAPIGWGKSIASQTLQYFGMQFVPSTLHEALHLQTVWKEAVLDTLEKGLLTLHPISNYKKDRLHALKLREVKHSANEVKRIRAKLVADQNNSCAAEVIAETQRQLHTEQDRLERHQQQEAQLWKNTNASKYSNIWQEKYINAKSGEYNKMLSSSRKEALKQEAEIAKQQAVIYFSDEVSEQHELWQESINALYHDHKGNFLDTTNIYGVVDQIIDGAVVKNGLDKSARNKIAEHCANEIIRYKYPFYPTIGEIKTIETERRKLIANISTRKLENFHRKWSRVRKRLQNKIEAELTGSPEQKVHKYHRLEYITKGPINEIVGGMTGWVPFKDYTGNGSLPRKGAPSLQLQSGEATGPSLSLNTNGHKLVTLYDFASKKVTGSSARQPQPQELPPVNTTSVNASHPSVDTMQPDIKPATKAKIITFWRLANSSKSLPLSQPETADEDLDDILDMGLHDKSGRVINEKIAGIQDLLTVSDAREQLAKLHSDQIYALAKAVHDHKHHRHNTLLRILSTQYQATNGVLNQRLKNILNPIPKAEAFAQVVPVGIYLLSSLGILNMTRTNSEQPKSFLGKAMAGITQAFKFVLFYNPLHTRNMMPIRADLPKPLESHGFQESKPSVYTNTDGGAGKLSAKQEGFEAAKDLGGESTVFPVNQAPEKHALPFPAAPLLSFYGYFRKQGNPDHTYHPAPKELPGFPEAVRAQKKTPTSGGLRARWELPNKRILEWDKQHGEVEMYTKNGKHLGAFDPETGKQIKDAKPDRTIKKYL